MRAPRVIHDRRTFANPTDRTVCMYGLFTKDGQRDSNRALPFAQACKEWAHFLKHGYKLTTPSGRVFKTIEYVIKKVND